MTESNDATSVGSARKDLPVRIGSLDAARGLAALMVAVFHFGGRPPMNGTPWLAPIEDFAWVGVEAFFVVSGFIVPASFLAFGSTVRASGLFFLRRIARLYVPFLAALFLAVALSLLSSVLPGYRGDGNVLPSMSTLGCNLFYACGVTGNPWINPVFWSLAIEVQFYALICVAVPFMDGSHTRVLGVLLVASLLTLATWMPKYMAFHFMPFFALGWIAWCAYRLPETRRWIVFPAALAFVLAWWSHGTIATLAAAATMVLVIAWSAPPAWVIWLGTISYSLYLIHVPIGGRVINFGTRFELDHFGMTALVLLATGASVAAAWLFWRLIERPAHEWSRRLFANTSRPRNMPAVESV